MHLDFNILITYGGVAKKYQKGEYIFREDEAAYFYYQIIEGEVKLFSSNNDGKELIQGIFGKDRSFGEPPLLIDKPYPSTAQALTNCVIVKLRKERLLNIINDFPEFSIKIINTLATRIYNKANAVHIWVGQDPEEKLITFLNNYKGTNSKEIELIPYSRQQIADFTGLRVETVIRTLRRMNEENKVKIIDRKLYY